MRRRPMLATTAAAVLIAPVADAHLDRPSGTPTTTAHPL